MTRYLVIETAYLGDVIISLAIARALKQSDPSVHITYLVRADAAAIAAASPDVDIVIQFDKRGSESGHGGIRTKATELNALGFECVIALHSSDRTRSLVSQLSAPRKIGFVGRMSDVLNEAIPDEGWKDRYQRALLLLRPVLADTYSINSLPRIIGKPRADIDRFVEGARAMCLAPGSAWATKRWPQEHFVELGRMLAAEGYRILVIGGPEDTLAGNEIARACRPYALDLTGKASLLEAAYAISRCVAVVANDSSPTHLAVAVGTPVLTLFGPTVPEFGFAPPTGSGASLGIDLWCRPCTPHGSRECPIHTHECLQALPVETVFARALSLISTAIESF